MNRLIGSIAQNQLINTFQQVGNIYHGSNNYHPYSTQPIVQPSSNMGYDPNQFTPMQNLFMPKGQYSIIEGSQHPPTLGVQYPPHTTEVVSTSHRTYTSQGQGNPYFYLTTSHHNLILELILYNLLSHNGNSLLNSLI